MDVTVAILTVPQREELLGRAVGSVLGQTFSDFVLLIITDGAEYSDAVRSRYENPRISVLACGGIAKSRNAAVEAARGEFITFVGDDDFIAPNFLDTLVGTAKKNAADIAACGIENGDAHVPDGLYDTTGGMEALLRGEIPGTLQGKLFRRSLFDTVRFPEDRQLPDIATIWRLFAASHSVHVASCKLYADGGEVERLRAPDFEPKLLTADYIVEHLAANAEREEYIASHLPELRELSRHAGWAYMLEMIQHITELGLASCYAPLRYMRNELKTYWQDIMYGEYTRDIDRARMQRYV